MKILVTGGAGYIGSNTCVELLAAGHDVVIVDNLCNSSKTAISQIEAISGKAVAFYEEDLCKKEKLHYIIRKEKIQGVIHFAGLKAVGESVEQPLRYYQNNLESTLNLLDCVVLSGSADEETQVEFFVFSSSATVYGNPERVPITETFPCSTTNPYGATKLMQEQILKDVQQANPWMKLAILRYFNPVGAHSSGMLGENPKGIPNNLMPYIVGAATGVLPPLRIFGKDYPTGDGTGVRDYIHVTDLAKGHVAALAALSRNKENAVGAGVYNLGTGKGTSVLELVRAFAEVNDVDVPFEYAARRAGDIASCYADTAKAAKELGWQAEKTIADMCRSAWKAKQQNE